MGTPALARNLPLWQPFGCSNWLGIQIRGVAGPPNLKMELRVAVKIMDPTSNLLSTEFGLIQLENWWLDKEKWFSVLKRK